RGDDASVVVGGAPFAPPVTLPSGRLREPPDAVASADALIALDERAEAEAAALGAGRPVWRARRRQGAAWFVGSRAAAVPSAGPVVAVAGIADPAGFF